MLRYENKGTVIEIRLPEKHNDYSVECRYMFDKVREKYMLSMWLKRKDADETFKVDSQEIDTQYITSTKDTIKLDICRIVEQAYSIGYFDEYIERYEYTYQCFGKGNELFENERLGIKDE